MMRIIDRVVGALRPSALVTALGRGWDQLVRWAPEVLFALFLVSLAPLFYLLAGVVARLASSLSAGPGEFWEAVRADPWPAVSTVVCLLGTGAIAVVVLRSWTHIWAVARKMIVEALHRKVVVVLLLFFVVLMPSLPFILKTEGNFKSQVQIVISYSLTLAGVLLAVLAVFVCTASICSEIERKHVQITDTKPLARWQFVLGKLMGVVIMCSALLFLMAGAVYGLVRYMVRERDFSHLPQWEERKREDMLKEVREEVLVARRSFRPPLPDVKKLVDKEVQKFNEQGGTWRPSLRGGRREALTRRFQKHLFTVRSMGSLGWAVRGLRAGSEEPVYLRFEPLRTNLGMDKRARGVWWFYRVAEQSDKAESSGGEPQPRPVYRRPGTWVTEGFQEIAVPGWVVEPTGTLLLAYQNLEPNTDIQFDPEGGIEVLQGTEGFFPNYYRSQLIILCHITLLAALALMAGSALSFPVASFLVATILIVGLIGPWVSGIHMSTIVEGTDEALHVGFSHQVRVFVGQFLHFFSRGIILVFPQLKRYSPLGELVNGRIVSWGFVAEAAALMCFVKGTAAMLLGIYFYGRRELARVIA